MKPAEKQSPAPVVSHAGTSRAGQCTATTELESTAYTPRGPSVTTTSGTYSASAAVAAATSPHRAYAIASPALGRKAAQPDSWRNRARSQAPVSSHPASTNTSVPAATASVTSDPRQPGSTSSQVNSARDGAGATASAGGAGAGSP